jgi:hypothetical protein
MFLQRKSNSLIHGYESISFVPMYFLSLDVGDKPNSTVLRRYKNQRGETSLLRNYIGSDVPSCEFLDSANGLDFPF